MEKQSSVQVWLKDYPNPYLKGLKASNNPINSKGFREEETPLALTVKDCIHLNFLNSRLLSNFPECRRKVGGLVVVKEENNIELITFHNEQHFPFAYFDGDRVHRRLSRQEGQSIVVDSLLFKLPS